MELFIIGTPHYQLAIILTLVSISLGVRALWYETVSRKRVSPIHRAHIFRLASNEIGVAQKEKKWKKSWCDNFCRKNAGVLSTTRWFDTNWNDEHDQSRP